MTPTPMVQQEYGSQLTPPPTVNSGSMISSTKPTFNQQEPDFIRQNGTVRQRKNLLLMKFRCPHKKILCCFYHFSVLRCFLKIFYSLMIWEVMGSLNRVLNYLGYTGRNSRHMLSRAEKEWVWWEDV